MSEYWVMRVLGQNQRDWDEPTWLMSFDVEFMGGIGRGDLTTDLDKAMRFAGPDAVLDTWRTQSKTVPIRGDGKPNRPLTAWTISPEKHAT